MNEFALAGAGWKIEGRWTARAAAVRVTSDSDFLANPIAQEAAFNDLLRHNERLLRSNGAWSQIGTTIVGLRGDLVPITASGLTAAAHREGAPTVARYLAHRRNGMAMPESVPGRGDLSKFNQIEERLNSFAQIPYQSVSR
jgi:hypothetical protein